MIITLFSLAYALTVASASVTSLPLNDVQLVWAGVIRNNAEATTLPDSGSPTGTITVGGDRIDVEQTSRIPARLGLSFSFRYRWTVPRSEPIPHTVVWHFPEPGIRNPATGVVSREYKQLALDRYCSGEYVCSAGWTLSEPWELLPGPWSVEVIENGKVKLRHTFELVQE